MSCSVARRSGQRRLRKWESSTSFGPVRLRRRLAEQFTVRKWEGSVYSSIRISMFLEASRSVGIVEESDTDNRRGHRDHYGPTTFVLAATRRRPHPVAATRSAYGGSRPWWSWPPYAQPYHHPLHRRDREGRPRPAACHGGHGRRKPPPISIV